MCRWLAYQGRPIPIDTLLFKPVNSLIHQSLSAQRGHVPTNGDGFGLGWYGDLRKPGLYRDTMPAWNDFNLRSLSEQIRSRLFFAHVRASTGTSTARVNCHPFRYDRWLFMHNGQIGGWPIVRRELENLIADDLYPFREGSTDSEVHLLPAVDQWRGGERRCRLRPHLPSGRRCHGRPRHRRAVPPDRLPDRWGTDVRAAPFQRPRVTDAFPRIGRRHQCRSGVLPVREQPG